MTSKVSNKSAWETAKNCARVPNTKTGILKVEKAYFKNKTQLQQQGLHVDLLDHPQHVCELWRSFCTARRFSKGNWRESRHRKCTRGNQSRKNCTQIDLKLPNAKSRTSHINLDANKAGESWQNEYHSHTHPENIFSIKHMGSLISNDDYYHAQCYF